MADSGLGRADELRFDEPRQRLNGAEIEPRQVMRQDLDPDTVDDWEAGEPAGGMPPDRDRHVRRGVQGHIGCGESQCNQPPRHHSCARQPAELACPRAGGEHHGVEGSRTLRCVEDDSVRLRADAEHPGIGKIACSVPEAFVAGGLHGEFGPEEAVKRRTRAVQARLYEHLRESGCASCHSARRCGGRGAGLDARVEACPRPTPASS